MQALRRLLEVQRRSRTMDRQSIRWEHEIGRERIVSARRQSTPCIAVAFDDDVAF